MKCQPDVMHRINLADGRTLIVRNVIPTDGPAIKRFFEHLSEDAREMFYPHPASDAAISDYITRAIAGRDWTCVALCGKTIVAYFFLHDIDRASPVLGIGIADDCQGFGLGQRLMRHLITGARTLGKTGIALTTRTENARAFHIYRKMGFQCRGDVPAMDRHGASIREHQLFLPLSPDTDGTNVAAD